MRKFLIVMVIMFIGGSIVTGTQLPTIGFSSSSTATYSVKEIQIELAYQDEFYVDMTSYIKMQVAYMFCIVHTGDPANACMGDGRILYKDGITRNNITEDTPLYKREFLSRSAVTYALSVIQVFTVGNENKLYFYNNQYPNGVKIRLIIL